MSAEDLRFLDCLSESCKETAKISQSTLTKLTAKKRDALGRRSGENERALAKVLATISSDLAFLVPVSLPSGETIIRFQRSLPEPCLPARYEYHLRYDDEYKIDTNFARSTNASSLPQCFEPLFHTPSKISPLAISLGVHYYLLQKESEQLELSLVSFRLSSQTSVVEFEVTPLKVAGSLTAFKVIYVTQDYAAILLSSNFGGLPARLDFNKRMFLDLNDPIRLIASNAVQHGPELVLGNISIVRRYDSLLITNLINSSRARVAGAKYVVKNNTFAVQDFDNNRVVLIRSSAKEHPIVVGLCLDPTILIKTSVEELTVMKRNVETELASVRVNKDTLFVRLEREISNERYSIDSVLFQKMDAIQALRDSRALLEARKYPYKLLLQNRKLFLDDQPKSIPFLIQNAKVYCLTKGYFATIDGDGRETKIPIPHKYHGLTAHLAVLWATQFQFAVQYSKKHRIKKTIEDNLILVFDYSGTVVSEEPFARPATLLTVSVTDGNTIVKGFGGEKCCEIIGMDEYLGTLFDADHTTFGLVTSQGYCPLPQYLWE